MSENRKWRCPYCDGLNDWENEVCEVCGDGRRPEAKTAEKAAEIPRVYTPQPRPEAPKAPELEASKPADTPSAPAPEPPVPEPPKKKRGGFLVTIVIIALAALGGRFLGQEMGKSFIKPQPTTKPVPITAPKVTLAPLPTATIIPAPTRAAAATRTAAVTQAPAPPTPNVITIWNYRKASDAEINDAMSLFFRGTDQNGVDCALFMDPTGTHGGYMYSEDRRRYTYDMGSFVDEGSDTQFKLISPDGETTVINAKPLQGKEKAIQILSIGNKKFSNLVLQQSDTMKSMYSSMMLRAAHGETAATQPPARGGTATKQPSNHDGFRLAVGSKGDEVRRLQKALIKLGFLGGSADGIFGPKTEQAVKQAQASRGYKQTGVVDYEQYRDFTISSGILSGADFR